MSKRKIFVEKTAFDGVMFAVKIYAIVIILAVVVSQFEKFIDWIFELIK